MNGHAHHIGTGALVALLCTFAVGELAAQGSWARRSVGRTSVGVEYALPTFDGDEFTFFTSVLSVSGEVPVSERMSVEGELALAHASVDSESADRPSGSTLGNPYLGVAFHSEDETTSFRVGGRLPLIEELGDDDFATGVGIMTDFDHAERFMPEIVSLVGTGETRIDAGDGAVVTVGGGASFWVPTGEGGLDPELFLQYGAGVELPAGPLGFGANLTGRLLVTEEPFDFGESSVHHLAFTGRLADGRIRPAVQVRLPIDDDLREVLNYVVAVGVEIRGGN